MTETSRRLRALRRRIRRKVSVRRVLTAILISRPVALLCCLVDAEEAEKHWPPLLFTGPWFAYRRLRRRVR